MSTRQEQVEIPYLKEKAIHVTYDNGYQLVYVPKRGDVFNVSTWIRTGSIHEDDHNNGVSHFLEHLMFKGTERFSPGEFDKEMESMGAIINAATWKDFTFYYINGPKGDGGKKFEKALDMHADMLLFSTLPDSEIGEQYDPNDADTLAKKRERGVVIEEINMRQDQPWTKVFNTLNHMLYPDGHPYQRDVIGTPEIIGNIPRDEILRYYNTWYSAANMTTIVVGDFDFAWLEERIHQHFNFSKRPQLDGHEPEPGKPDLTKLGPDRYKEITGEYNTSFFIMAYHAPCPDDLKETIALDVASKILGEGRSSRLYQAFIERPKSPVFNIISCGQSTFTLGNVFYVQGNFNDPDHKKCIADVNREIEHYINNDMLTQEEFERAIKKMKVDFAETSETASGIAENIGESITIGGSINGYVKYLDELTRLTRDDVIAVARKYLAPEKNFTTVLIPKGAA